MKVGIRIFKINVKVAQSVFFLPRLQLKQFINHHLLDDTSAFSGCVCVLQIRLFSCVLQFIIHTHGERMGSDELRD